MILTCCTLHPGSKATNRVQAWRSISSPSLDSSSTALFGCLSACQDLQQLAQGSNEAGVVLSSQTPLLQSYHDRRLGSKLSLPPVSGLCRRTPAPENSRKVWLQGRPAVTRSLTAALMSSLLDGLVLFDRVFLSVRATASAIMKSPGLHAMLLVSEIRSHCL
jgi:hypothetical protein